MSNKLPACRRLCKRPLVPPTTSWQLVGPSSVVFALLSFVGKWFRVNRSMEERMRFRKITTSAKDHLPLISVLALSLFSLVGFSCVESSSRSSSPTELRHYDIKVSDLPAPEVLNGPRNQSRAIPKPEEAQLTVPAGLPLNVFSGGGLSNTRGPGVWPAGGLFLAVCLAAGGGTNMRGFNGDGRGEE